MDELVFQRESLIRKLQSTIELLETAAEKYDPEEIPAEDALAALSLFALYTPKGEMSLYMQTVKHRANQHINRERKP